MKMTRKKSQGFDILKIKILTYEKLNFNKSGKHSKPGELWPAGNRAAIPQRRFRRSGFRYRQPEHRYPVAR